MVVGPEKASVEEWLDSYLDGHEQAAIVVIRLESACRESVAALTQTSWSSVSTCL